MSDQIKSGKKPLSSKPQETSYNPDDVFSSFLNVPEHVKKELKEKGLEYRFIDIKKYQEANLHTRGWEPYKAENDASGKIVSNQDFFIGKSPDGFIRRGSLVLAVRTIAHGDRHRAFNQRKADQISTSNKERANEVREMAKRSGLGGKVFEGYDDNE